MSQPDIDPGDLTFVRYDETKPGSSWWVDGEGLPVLLTARVVQMHGLTDKLRAAAQEQTHAPVPPSSFRLQDGDYEYAVRTVPRPAGAILVIHKVGAPRSANPGQQFGSLEIPRGVLMDVLDKTHG